MSESHSMASIKDTAPTGKPGNRRRTTEAEKRLADSEPAYFVTILSGLRQAAGTGPLNKS
jgi:hypothetical protein